MKDRLTGRTVARGAVLLLVGAIGGCMVGDISGADADVTAHAQQAVISGARRLTRVEYDNTLRDLLGDASNSGFAELPEDANDPFDNNYKTQLVSPQLIEAAEKLATEAALRALADPKIHQKLIPCTPTGPGDADCLSKVITSFGRRALRRPLSNDEVAGYLSLQAYAVEGNNFDIGVELFLRAVLQDPEFLYRIELGTPVEGVAGAFKLSDHEVATRLSYFLWGTTPSDSLLDLADAHQLSTPAQIRAAAATMIADPRAKDRVNRFHALWLSYHQLPHPPALTAELRAETSALIDRVIFEEPQDYFDLFTYDKTFINDDLADHYGLPKPGSTTGAWVSYGSSGRKGILSHGTVLSAGAKFTDTSPTQRGKFVRTRLLCQEIPPPPPNVKADAPPTSMTSSCKVDIYKEHANNGSCKSCHEQMDPIGFGLENYDKSGAYRATELNKPECTIDGKGELAPLGSFTGPAGLADKLIETGELERCVVTQLYRFAIGRREDGDDAAALQDLGTQFKESKHSFDQLMVDLVSADAFGYRKEEE
jgi:hypothetical protein